MVTAILDDLRLVRLSPGRHQRPAWASEHCDQLATEVIAGRLPRPDPTFLTAAAERGKLDRIEEELEGGVEVDARDAKGRTALYVAANHVRLVALQRLLLAARADPNARSSPFAGTADGQARDVQATALMGVASAAGCTRDKPQVCNDQLEIARVLLRAGARAELRDFIGRTAAEWVGTNVIGHRDPPLSFDAHLRAILQGNPAAAPPEPVDPSTLFRRLDVKGTPPPATTSAPTTASTPPGAAGGSGSTLRHGTWPQR